MLLPHFGGFASPVTIELQLIGLCPIGQLGIESHVGCKVHKSVLLQIMCIVVEIEVGVGVEIQRSLPVEVIASLLATTSEYIERIRYARGPEHAYVAPHLS